MPNEAANRLERWLAGNLTAGSAWYAKRLSGNDTGATGGHQSGIYCPKDLVFHVFPELERAEELNPSTEITMEVDSHGLRVFPRIVWYNNRIFDAEGRGTRNELRMTRLGGRVSPFGNQEYTGALAILVFERSDAGGVFQAHAWVCESEDEAEVLQTRIGPTDPGYLRYGIVAVRSSGSFRQGRCRLAREEIPPAWLARFPSGAELVERTVSLHPGVGESPDARLIARRVCEYEIFQSLEESIELPRIQQGFKSIDDFLNLAQTVLQRRKARSGRSLELQLKRVFEEAGLTERRDFAFQAETEPSKKVDFIFPSVDAYRDPGFPASRLRFLGVKTTCRDRWRQILNEADRVAEKHLLTLQEGISEAQFKEMQVAGVRLVVPSSVVKSYPRSVQPELRTVSDFIAEVRLL
jgi:hypothetical protein